jgi:hypothetical protein
MLYQQGMMNAKSRKKSNGSVKTVKQQGLNVKEQLGYYNG